MILIYYEYNSFLRNAIEIIMSVVLGLRHKSVYLFWLVLRFIFGPDSTKKFQDSNSRFQTKQITKPANQKKINYTGWYSW